MTAPAPVSALAAVPASAAPVSPRQIAAATCGAALVASLLLVAVVLPAEYGIDPLGSGAWLGLTALAEPESRANAVQPGPFLRDSIEFTLEPYQSVEYKYRIESGASMLYSWQADGAVRSDFHGEPDGAPAGTAQSFEQLPQSEGGHGVFSAPFAGLHGWYWENRGRRAVTIRLATAGFYSAPREYFDGRVFPRELTDAAPVPPVRR